MELIQVLVVALRGMTTWLFPKTIGVAQEAQLKEVAALMDTIYTTLAEMQYLDPADISRGPHNMKHLQPLYKSLDLDPSIIYLYSILPYVETDAIFLMEALFADFRDPGTVEEGRDPMFASPNPEIKDYDAKDGPYIRPWVTPLAMMGNHGLMILYDAKSHRIWMLDGEDAGSNDLELQRLREEVLARENRAGSEAGWFDHAPLFMSNVELQRLREKTGDEPGWLDQLRFWLGGLSPRPNKNHLSFEDVPSRPAGDVLRDINTWFRTLVVPLGEDDTSPDIFQTTGWPDKFDVRGFVIAQARADAEERARYAAEDPIRKVEGIQRWVNFSKGDVKRAGDELRRVAHEASQVELRKWHDAMAVKVISKKQKEAALAGEGELQEIPWEDLQEWISEEALREKDSHREEVQVENGPEDEKLWMARLDLFEKEQELARALKLLWLAEEKAEKLCPGGLCQKKEDLPLWELWQMEQGPMMSREEAETFVLGSDNHKWDDEMTDKDNRRSKASSRKDRKIMWANRLAYEVSKTEAVQLCPGRTWESVPMIRAYNDVEREFATEILNEKKFIMDITSQEIKAIREWASAVRLPVEATSVRQRIEESLAKQECYLKRIRKDLAGTDLEAQEQVEMETPEQVEVHSKEKEKEKEESGEMEELEKGTNEEL